MNGKPCSSGHQKDLCSNPASAPCLLLTLAGCLNSLSSVSLIGKCPSYAPAVVESYLALLSERPALGHWLAVHFWINYVTTLTYISLIRFCKD